MIALGAKSIGTLFQKLTRVERWARRITRAGSPGKPALHLPAPRKHHYLPEGNLSA
jgi:hypothetical protein